MQPADDGQEWDKKQKLKISNTAVFLFTMSFSAWKSLQFSRLFFEMKIIHQISDSDAVSSLGFRPREYA